MTRPRSPDLGPGLGSSPPTTQMRLWEMVENSKKHDFQTSRRAFAQELRLLSPQKGLDRHTRSQDDPRGFHHPLAFICTPNIPQNKMVAIYGIMPEWKMEKQANRAAAGIFGTQPLSFHFRTDVPDRKGKICRSRKCYNSYHRGLSQRSRGPTVSPVGRFPSRLETAGGMEQADGFPLLGFRSTCFSSPYLWSRLVPGLAPASRFCMSA